MSDRSARTIRFLGPKQCALQEVPLPEGRLSGGQFLLETEFSVLSAGTELANYSGVDPTVFVPGSWNEYPSTPGYGAIGRVVEVSSEGTGRPGMPKVGERIFAFTHHASFAVGDIDQRFIVPVGEGEDGVVMVLVRMAGVAITAVRRAVALQPGASAVVLGLGVVGNFAAQLLQLSGLDVRAFDPDPYRADVARQVGISKVDERSVTGPDSPASEEVKAAGGADIVVEATGLSSLAEAATPLARRGGQVILLGSPRVPYPADLTPMLRDVHLRGLTLTGALEWTLPLTGTHRLHGDSWSLQDNYAYLLAAFAGGALRGKELVSKVASPEEAPAIYAELLAGARALLGVVFDWRSR